MHARTYVCAAGLLGAGLLAAPLAAQGPAPKLGVDSANFDRGVRPQDDFYRFVNGSWLKQKEIPADRSRYGSFDELREQSEAALRTLIEQAAAETSHQPGSDLQKIGDLYASYMDTARIEARGVEPLAQPLKEIQTLSNKRELPELFANLQRLGVQTPFGFFVGQDAKQSTRYIASVSQSGLGLPDRDYYLKSDTSLARVRSAYQGYVETLLRLAGEPDAAAAAKHVVALETRLAQSHWERAKNRDRELTYNLRTLAQMDSLTPAFSWATFIDAVDAEKTPAVVVRQPDYLPALNAAIEQTPLSVWKQYLTFKLLDSYASALSRPFADAQFEFRGRVLQGLQEQRPRWKRGVGVVEGSLGEVAGRLYVEQNFTPAQKQRMQQLVDNLVAAFREGIDGLEWMSPQTKQQAQAKLAKFNVKIGYPEKWRDYSKLQIARDDLAGNLLRTARFEHDRMIGRLGKPIDRAEWGMTPQTVNAYYSSTMNEIVFPAAILQPPFFDMSADDAVNYGAIGGVIGHEISHGFDDQGRRSDGEGNLRDWWTAQDNEKFQQRANRLVEQYNGFSPMPGLNVNGRLTLGENIGDLSGLAVAYQAYRRSLGGKPAPVIDGFTGDQRFFLGWAQIWRGKYRDAAMRQQLLTDPHSPPEFRVNGTLRNLPEFHAAFGVKPGDPMYLPPEQRVKLW